MTGSSHPAGNLSEQEKMLLARGAKLDSGAIDLEMLIALASDGNTAVRQTAGETLARLTDSE